MVLLYTLPSWWEHYILSCSSILKVLIQQNSHLFVLLLLFYFHFRALFKHIHFSSLCICANLRAHLQTVNICLWLLSVNVDLRGIFMTSMWINSFFHIFTIVNPQALFCCSKQTADVVGSLFKVSLVLISVFRSCCSTDTLVSASLNETYLSESKQKLDLPSDTKWWENQICTDRQIAVKLTFLKKPAPGNPISPLKWNVPSSHILLVTDLHSVHQTVAQNKLLIFTNGTWRIKWQLVRIGRFRKETLRIEMVASGISLVISSPMTSVMF